VYKDRILLAIEDVTAQTSIQPSLQEPETKYQTLIENLSSIIIGVNPAGKITFFNNFAEKLFGYNRSDMLGKNFVGDLIPCIESSGKDNTGLVQDMLAHIEQHYINESEGMQRNGKRVFFSWSAREIRDRNGTITDIFIDGTDLTPVREQLTATRQAFDMINNSPDAVFRYNRNYRYLYANKSAEQLTGYSADDIIGKQLGELGMSPEQVTVLKEMFERAAQTKQSESCEVQYNKRIMQTLVVPEMNNRGAVASFVTYSRDITQLRKSQERYLMLYETMTQGVIHQDAEGCIFSANMAALSILGKTLEDIIGSSSEIEEKNTIREDGTPFPGVEHPAIVALRTGRQVRGVVMGVYHYPKQRYVWIKIDAIPLFRNGESHPYEVYTIFDDITERRKAEEALHNSELRLRSIIDNLAEGVVVVDPVGGVLQWNAAALRMHGYNHQESELGFLSKITEVFELITADGTILPLEQWPVSRVLRGEQLHDYDVYVRHKRQDWQRFFTYNGTLVCDSGGKPRLGFLSIRDITERKKVEEESHRREAAYRTLAENAPVGIIRINAQGTYLYVNREAEHIMRSTREQIVGSTAGMFGMTEKAQESFRENIVQSFTTGQQISMELSLSRQERTHHYQVKFVPEHIGGHISSVLALLTDITERKESEERLRKATATAEIRARETEEGRRILDALMDNIPEGIIIADAEGRIQSISKYLARISGYERQNITGKDFMIIDKVLDLPGRGHPVAGTAIAVEKMTDLIEYPLGRALRKGEVTLSEEHQVYAVDGSVHTAVLTAVPIRDSSGRIVGGASTWRDITDRKKAEDALQSANRELEQFAYVASHDLQEPLRMMASFAELLEQQYRDKFDERGQRYLEYIVGGASRMQALIRDLLTFSRAGRFDIERRQIDLDTVVDNVTMDLSGAIREAQAEVTHDPLPSINANASAMGRLFTNLIGNALKFRKKDVPSRIHVSVLRRGRDWQFAVSDNGIGIDPKFFNKVFIIFQRLHTGKEYPGTGMGLAISRKIVESYGGKIWIESEPGKGSTFYFTIPRSG
jgi:PAS domain S-box-containing protein